MGIKATLGGRLCPACGMPIHYGGVEEIDLFVTKCEYCGREWEVIHHPDGRTEVREKKIQ